MSATWDREALGLGILRSSAPLLLAVFAFPPAVLVHWLGSLVGLGLLWSAPASRRAAGLALATFLALAGLGAPAAGLTVGGVGSVGAEPSRAAAALESLLLLASPAALAVFAVARWPGLARRVGVAALAFAALAPAMLFVPLPQGLELAILALALLLGLAAPFAALRGSARTPSA